MQVQLSFQNTDNHFRLFMMFMCANRVELFTYLLFHKFAVEYTQNDQSMASVFENFPANRPYLARRGENPAVARCNFSPKNQ